MAGHMPPWHKLPTSLTELCINTTLRCGQSFRWRKSAEDEWSMALHGRILSLRQDTEHIHYRAVFPRTTPAPLTPPRSATSPATSETDNDDTLALIRHYFNLRVDLGDLYEQWAAADANFKKKAPRFAGIRILRQDAWEALVGFICSSNNNISRISSMVQNLCTQYGPLIGHIGGVAYHDFPTPEALCGVEVEASLRRLGFGYRAKYIATTARLVAKEKGLSWLNNLSNPEHPQFGVPESPAGDMTERGREGYRKAHEELLVLQGVGPKVSDCVCLFGLGWSESVPVDTHVWQIAQRDYKFGRGKNSTLTTAMYDNVANHFRNLWGKEAGWAHSVLFTADLKAFSDRVATKVATQNDEIAIKTEDGGLIDKDIIIKKDKRRIKKEPIEDLNHVVEIKQEGQRRSKRMRR